MASCRTFLAVWYKFWNFNNFIKNDLFPKKKDREKVVFSLVYSFGGTQDVGQKFMMSDSSQITAMPEI